MTTTVDVLPDVPKMARAWLLTQTDLTSLVGQRISTRTKGTFPEVVLQRIGGIPSIPRRLDSARIQVDCYGNTEGEASRTARVARTALHLMERYVTDLAVCTGVEDDLGLAWIPDTTRTPETPRFIFGVLVHARSI